MLVILLRMLLSVSLALPLMVSASVWLSTMILMLLCSVSQISPVPSVLVMGDGSVGRG